MAADMLSVPSVVSGGDQICDDSSFEDGCSICLEPFNSLDPQMLTKCKHEYHFQCILEWSQRSDACPICSQPLVLKDPASQLLLDGLQSDRNLKHNFYHVDQDNDVNNDSPQDEQRITRQFTAVASGAININGRRRRMTLDIVHPEALPSVPIPNMSSMTRVNSSLEVHQNLASCFSNFDLATSSGSLMQRASSLNIPSFGNSPSHTPQNSPFCVKSSESSPHNPGRANSSDLLAFSASLKSKISMTSTRYKESISKSTRNLKEKLITRNGSVKQLSREVQREMSAGIARMIECLDFSTKKATFTTGNSKSQHECEAKEENSMVQSAIQNTEEAAHDKILAAPTGAVTVSCAEVKK